MISLSKYCFLFFLISLISCDKGTNGNDVLLAKVYDSKLYQSDIDSYLKEDTISYNKKQFIDAWVRNELYINSASLSKADRKEIEQLTASFEKTLIIQKQKENHINRNLVTTVQEEELQQAYNELKDNYKLKRDIFKYHLVVVEKSHPNVLDIRNFFKQREFDAFYESLDDEIASKALDSTQWYHWVDLSLKLPIDEIGEGDISGDMNKIIEGVDHIFFLRIFDYIDKTEIAPLSYMKRNLENAILEKRKEKLIDDYSGKLYQSALNNNKIILN